MHKTYLHFEIFKSTKHQKTNHKKIPMTKYPNSKQCPGTNSKSKRFGHWDFGFGYYLLFGI